MTSIGRRYELLGWASAKDNRYLVEDDYDCEFRLTGRPIPSLQSIDATGKVDLRQHFHESLGPAFRIGYLVLPPALAVRFRRELGFYSCTVSAIDQLALARFIESGDYERHVNRLRTYYRSVRDALVSAFQASSFSERVSIEEQDAGIHFIMGISIDAKMPEVRKSAPQGMPRVIGSMMLSLKTRRTAANPPALLRRAAGNGNLLMPPRAGECASCRYPCLQQKRRTGRAPCGAFW